jgi:hypothetical protein
LPLALSQKAIRQLLFTAQKTHASWLSCLPFLGIGRDGGNRTPNKGFGDLYYAI